MESFTVVLEIYNLSMVLLVTPLAKASFCFAIRLFSHEKDAMTINRLPDLSWNVEDNHNKFFTLANIQRLGALIEINRPNLFPQGIL